MGVLRIYKKFYWLSGGVYTLITPTSVTASCFIAGTGSTESSTLIESNIPVIEEQLGVFYANLTSGLYSSDSTYDLVFYVQYTTEAPLNKKLSTRFRITTTNIASQLDFEISNTMQIGFEINENNPIEYEIIGTFN